MASLTIFGGLYSRGEAVVGLLQERFHLKEIDDLLLERTAQSYGIPKAKLLQAMQGPLPVFNRITREREKCIARLKLTLAELSQEDGFLLTGFAGLLVPRNLTHVLRVCLAAQIKERVRWAVEHYHVQEKQARKAIRKDENERQQWARFLFGKSPWDEGLYDVFLPMEDDPAKAAGTIADSLLNDAVRPSDRSKQAALDNILAARVNLKLVDAGHDAEVSAADGVVTLQINKSVANLNAYGAELKKLIMGIDGVKEVEAGPGAHYTPPPIFGSGDLELPTRILLVDDEKEFVHTLSERLQTRNLPSWVAYDGEEALSSIEREEPEVMVLDLKMPGIDGLEVLRRVRKSHPQVRVIILTGHGSDKEREIAAELGAFAYLQKPVNIDLLAQTLRDAYKSMSQ